MRDHAVHSDVYDIDEFAQVNWSIDMVCLRQVCISASGAAEPIRYLDVF